ncbi:MAG: glycosyltransferase family 2 protein [Patescibacteria group bacterium]
MCGKIAILIMKHFTSISIVIPAYNEEENLQWIVKNTLKELPVYFKDFEIIIVDDGSTDKTVIIANKLQSTNPQVKVIHQKNGGYSKAMLTGIKAANKEYIAYMPADGQFLISDMRHCFEVMNDNDMILGYRGGRPDYNFKRIIFSYGYLLLLSLLFNIKYMDVGWVIIWRTSKIKKIKFTSTNGIFLLTESLVRFQQQKYRVTDAPSYYHPRKSGLAKNVKLKVVLQTLLSALKFWFLIKYESIFSLRTPKKTIGK